MNPVLSLSYSLKVVVSDAERTLGEGRVRDYGLGRLISKLGVEAKSHNQI